MSFAEEVPPAKKQRVLKPTTSSHAPFTSSPAVPKQRFFKDVEDETKPSPATSLVSERHALDGIDRFTTSMAFDQELFESFVGENLPPDTLRIIRENCGVDMERAINMYLDGTWKRLKSKSGLVTCPSALPGVGYGDENVRIAAPTTRLVARDVMPDARYIGAFGAEGWITRSGSNLLTSGDAVKIERQKMQPFKPKAGRGRGKAGAGTLSLAASQRVDMTVRFANSAGAEVGRLEQRTARWVSTLMDQKMCKFEGTCIYAPDSLRTNDTVFLQIKCFVLKSAFRGRQLDIADNRTTGLFEASESLEERHLRLRQMALVMLFQEIKLVPTRSSATSSKHRRIGLLAAAEVAEKEKQNEATKPSDSPSQSDKEDGKELEQDQLDALYKKAQSFDFNTPESEAADTFAMSLRPYQKQSLHWMLAKEKDKCNKDRESSMHPLWEEYSWPVRDHDDQDLPRVANQTVFYVNPYSGELSLEFPVQEQHCLGGILADEMGLGKTIQMLSLVHTHQSEVAMQAQQASHSNSRLVSLPRLPSASFGVLDALCTTLVVAPTSLLSQWQGEVEHASKEGRMRSMVYYGPEKNTIDLRSLCCSANAANAPHVIITSYGVILSEYGQIAAANKADRGNSRGLFALNFFRLILDEGHLIKNRQSKTARACYEIVARHRWVLTGTPIVNRLEDLYSLVRFLRVEPWNNFSFWRTFITVPFESKDFVRALDVVQTVLEPLVMRRTKDMKTPDGKALIALPPKSIEIVNVQLSQDERAIYDHVLMRAKRTFLSNMEAGTVLKAYTSIFAQVLRLRQCCCHPFLVRHQPDDEFESEAAGNATTGLADDMDLNALIEHFTATADDALESNQKFGAHVLQQIRDEAANECPICAEEPMVEQTVTGCWHSACKKCLLDYLEYQTSRQEVPRCFNCREPISSRDLFEVVRHDDDDAAPRVSLTRIGANDSSVKIVALIKHLRALRRDHPRIKSVVFSQFTSLLSLIEPHLARANMRFLRLDGSLPQRARAAVLHDFSAHDDGFCVLLISLRAGGVGLNLTCARRVYMMDPWWSFAVEAQAIDRVHRMGQAEEVRVYRFIVRDSVEEKMLRIQNRKKFLATSLGMMSDEDKKKAMIEDIKELLS